MVVHILDFKALKALIFAQSVVAKFKNQTLHQIFYCAKVENTLIINFLIILQTQKDIRLMFDKETWHYELIS